MYYFSTAISNFKCESTINKQKRENYLSRTDRWSLQKNDCRALLLFVRKQRSVGRCRKDFLSKDLYKMSTACTGIPPRRYCRSETRRNSDVENQKRRHYLRRRNISKLLSRRRKELNSWRLSVLLCLSGKAHPSPSLVSVIAS